jgi:hypothetical protein
MRAPLPAVISRNRRLSKADAQASRMTPLLEVWGDEVPAPRPPAVETKIDFAGTGGQRALDGNYRAHGHPSG